MCIMGDAKMLNALLLVAVQRCHTIDANQMALLLVAQTFRLRSFRVEECSIHLTTRLLTATLH